jgi:hypothetical protein
MSVDLTAGDEERDQIIGAFYRGVVPQTKCWCETTLYRERFSSQNISIWWSDEGRDHDDACPEENFLDAGADFQDLAGDHILRQNYLAYATVCYWDSLDLCANIVYSSKCDTTPVNPRESSLHSHIAPYTLCLCPCSRDVALPTRRVSRNTPWPSYPLPKQQSLGPASARSKVNNVGPSAGKTRGRHPAVNGA